MKILFITLEQSGRQILKSLLDDNFFDTRKNQICTFGMNSNYKDFRNPSYTELMISKDGKRMGTYLVDTKEYIKDLRDLEVKDRVMEGTCGYGEDGKIGTIPAGAHLQKEESEGDKEIRALEKKAAKELA